MKGQKTAKSKGVKSEVESTDEKKTVYTERGSHRSSNLQIQPHVYQDACDQ
jgi:hypothetical protein